MAVFSITADDEIDSNKAFILLGMSGALKVGLRAARDVENNDRVLMLINTICSQK